MVGSYWTGSEVASVSEVKEREHVKTHRLLKLVAVAHRVHQVVMLHLRRVLRFMIRVTNTSGILFGCTRVTLM